MSGWRSDPSFDPEAYQRDMRARFVTRENLAKLFSLVFPHLDPATPSLVYILTQPERIGHLALEPQILKTIYGETYGRIVIVTGPLNRPGVNRQMLECLGDGFVFVETDDEVILSMGYLDGGLADLQRVHLLLQSPRALMADCWSRVVAGTPMARFTLPQGSVDPASERLRGVGLDPQAPFAVLHMRTMQYLPGHAHHGHRTVSTERYGPCVRAMLDAGYQVVRIGEPDQPLPPGDWDGYVSLPDAVPDDRSVDLFAMARAAFGVIQNSGPMVVLAGFGCRTLRTNLPLEHMTLAYNDDLMLFKPYRENATGRAIGYREILDRRLPALQRDAELEAEGIELVENTPEALLAATHEMLAAIEGGRRPDAARNDRFFALGAEYEAAVRDDPWFRSENLQFYSYAHRLGAVTEASFDASPGFLD